MMILESRRQGINIDREDCSFTRHTSLDVMLSVFIDAVSDEGFERIGGSRHV